MDTYAADVTAMVKKRDFNNAVRIGHSTGGGEVARNVAHAQAGGVDSRSVNLATGKYAVVEKSKEFTLVQWRLEMEQFRGKTLYGTTGSQEINSNWDAGRSRGIGIS
jgi:hypothetical protein